jgi:hypothetical protein
MAAKKETIALRYSSQSRARVNNNVNRLLYIIYDFNRRVKSTKEELCAMVLSAASQHIVDILNYTTTNTHTKELVLNRKFVSSGLAKKFLNLSQDIENLVGEYINFLKENEKNK